MGMDGQSKTSLLKAQGYGARWKDCWVPKHSYQQAPQSPRPRKHQLPNLRWIPKPQSLSIITEPSPQPRKPKPNPIWKWVPKKPTPVQPNLETKTLVWETPSVQSQPLQRWQPKNPAIQTITKLPGRSSISSKPTKPETTASTSPSTIQWRSCLLQALLQHKITQHLVTQHFIWDTQCVAPIP